MGDMRDEARELLQRLLLHVLGHAGGFDLLAQLFDLALALVLLAQLLLDGLHLLAQVVVALRLLHLVLHLGLDLGAQLLHLDLLGQVLVELLQALDDAGRFQQLLLVVGGEERQRRGDKIDQAARLFDVGGNGPQLVGQRRRLGDNLLELADHVAHQRFDARSWLPAPTSSSGLDLGHHERLGLDVAHQPHPLHAFGKDKAALVGHAHDLVHRGQGAHGMQIAGLGRVQAGVELRGHHNGPLFAQRLDQLDGALAANRQRQNGVGKQDGVPHGQDGNSAHAGAFFAGLFAGGRRSGRLIRH